VVFTKKLRNKDNIFVTHLAWTDLAYATIVIIITATDSRSVTTLGKMDIQTGGGINLIAYLSWLFSATCIALTKYLNVVKMVKLNMTQILCILAGVWAYIIALACWVDYEDAYALTPSGYSFIEIKPATNHKIALAVVIFLSFIVPVLMCTFFYIEIYRVFRNCVKRRGRRIWHTNDPNIIRQHEVLEGILWKVALKSSAYIIIVSITMMPIGISFLLQGIFDIAITPWADCILLCLLESYKLFSPIITLKVNKPIQEQLIVYLRLDKLFPSLKKEEKNNQTGNTDENAQEPKIDYNYQA
jgi:hypothetical protein